MGCWYLLCPLCPLHPSSHLSYPLPRCPINTFRALLWPSMPPEPLRTSLCPFITSSSPQACPSSQLSCPLWPLPLGYPGCKGAKPGRWQLRSLAPGAWWRICRGLARARTWCKSQVSRTELDWVETAAQKGLGFKGWPGILLPGLRGGRVARGGEES